MALPEIHSDICRVARYFNIPPSLLLPNGLLVGMEGIISGALGVPICWKSFKILKLWNNGSCWLNISSLALAP